MSKFDKHFLLTVEDAPVYTKYIGLFPQDASLEASEIGDGNINYIFKVVDKNTKKSVVLKQADVLLRSSGRPLDVVRNKIEMEILTIQGKLAPTQVPKVLNYDEKMCIIAMEDISEYKNLRKELAENRIFPEFAQWISDFLANTLLPTTDLVLDPHKKKDLVRNFINKELCEISETLVFNEPYLNDRGRNIITKGNEEFVKEWLYMDKALHTEVAKLKNSFMNNAQGLIHGDLHSGSIFICEKGIKIIDPEFSFYGPMGYDIGNVIGNLFFAYVNKKYTMRESKEKEVFLSWIKESIAMVFDKFILKFNDKFDKEVKDLIFRDNEFKSSYLNGVLSDSIGYAGTEIIRRVVGDAKVLELTTIEDRDIRIKVERELIQIGIRLIKNRENIKYGKEIIKEL